MYSYALRVHIMQKAERQARLRELIRRERFRSQGELTMRLAEIGFPATQASVSRDLDELGVVKVHGMYTLPDGSRGPSQFGPVQFQAVGDNLIIAKTLSGLASAITVRIDSAGIPGVIGTLAGDDTIFIAVKDRKSQSQALKQVQGVFN